MVALDRSGRPYPDECTCIARWRPLCTCKGRLAGRGDRPTWSRLPLLGARGVPGPGGCERADPSAGWLSRQEPGLERPPARARGLVEDRSGRGCSNWHAPPFPTSTAASGAGSPIWREPLGVNNLNESAGGFAGLGTLLWLAPLAVVVTAGERFEWPFLAGLGLFGAMGALRIPPVDNLLRALPVLEVTDNRRLTLWVSFALVLLGGIGLDSLADHAGCRGSGSWPGRIGRVVLRRWPRSSPRSKAGSRAGPGALSRESAATAGADALVYRQRAERQVSQVLDFLPRYYGLIALELAAARRACLSVARRRPRACGGYDRLCFDSCSSTWPDWGGA